MIERHGLSKTLTYKVWAVMKDRCQNPKSNRWDYYGGRGIKVCERWQTFMNFYADMGLKPKGLSIERKDVNGNYCPENCCWGNQKAQVNNTRKNVFIEFNGQKLTVSQASELAGIDYNTFHSRLQRGWSVKQAIETKPSLHNRLKALA